MEPLFLLVKFYGSVDSRKHSSPTLTSYSFYKDMC